MKGFNSYAVYVSFVKQRNSALEKIHFNYQMRIADTLRDLFTKTISHLCGLYPTVKDQIYSSHGRASFDRATRYVDGLCSMASISILHDVIKLRHSVRTITLAAEAEAIARVFNYERRPGRAKNDVNNHLYRKMPSGGDSSASIRLYLDRVKADLMDAFKSSAVQNYEHDEMLRRLLRALPKDKKAVAVRKMLARPKLTEAAGDSLEQAPFDLVVDLGLSDQEWDSAVDDYLTDYVPKFRSPEFELLGEHDPGTDDGKQSYYAWELENDVTNDFVKSVRDGQIEAANANGITDFVWIAVVDDRIDDCCLWRDELLTSEIEAQLNGDHSDDECEVSVPPAHFNCRCDLAPATDEIPDVPDSGFEDFDTWLNQDS